KLQARLKMLQSEVQKQVQRVTEAWAKRREGAVVERPSSGGERKKGLSALRAFVQEKIGLRKNRREQEREEPKAESSDAGHPRQESEDLQAAQGDVLERVKRLTDTLAEETKRRQGAEREAGETAQRRSELEGQLGQVRQELETSQKQLQAQQ